MRSEKKTKKIHILFLCIAAIVAVLFAIPTFSWLIATFSTNISITGNVIGSYFEQGDGTRDTPYVIVKPIQLYYFAWLQNIGKFQGDNPASTTADKKYYFTLGADIDMSSNTDFATLPPIGTSTYPFKGVFDGKYHYAPKDGSADPLDLPEEYHVISNLTINNTDLTNIPTGGTQGMQYVGFFGVVGSMTDSNVVGEIKNFGLQDVTITTKEPINDKTIIGIVAGYCNGNASGIGVSGCKISVGKAGLTPVNVGDTNPETLSFGLIGYSDKTYEAYGISSISGGSSFGGSLSMSDLFNRISYAQDVNNGAVETTYFANKTVTIDADGNVTEELSDETVYQYDTTLTKYKLVSYEVKDDQNNVMQSYGSIVRLLDYGNNVVYLAGGITNYATQTVTTVGYKYYCYFSNGSGQYMVASGSNITSSSTPSTEWKFETESGIGLISYKSGNTTYYLHNNSGNLELTNDVDSATNWDIADGKISNNGYRLCYNNGWTLKIQNYYTIDNGLTGSDLRYMNISGSSLVAETSSTTQWYIESVPGFASSNYLYGVSGGTKYYVYRNNTSLALNKNSPSAVSAYRWLFRPAFGYIRNGSYNFIRCNYSSNKWTWACPQYRDTTNVWNPTSGKYPSNSTNINSVKISSVELNLGATAISHSSNTWNGVSYTQEQVPVSNVETFIPITINDDGSVSSRNTGYVVGGSNIDVGDNYPGDSLINCVTIAGNLTASLNSNSYSGDNLEILTRTNKTNGSYCRIEDAYNINNQSINSNISDYTKKTLAELGLGKYTNSRDQLEETLSGAQDIYGLLFRNSTISVDNKVVIPHAYINGNHKMNYYVPRDCIDFNLSKRGYVNFFAGTLSGNNTAFFSLHHIQRSGDTIVSIKQISKIYGHKTDDSVAYIYEYTDGTTSGVITADYEELFDMDWITNGSALNALQRAMYYFEIPLNSGEYALGSVSGESGAYLIYLDIGTSATSLDDGTTLETSITGVDFVEDGALTESREATLEAIASDSVAAAVIVLKTGFLGTITFDRTDEDESTFITCTLSNESSEVFVVWTKNSDDTFVVIETETSP